jgi:hypothetical protein
MIRTVSLWIRINGKFSQPLYQDNKQTRLKLQDGEYYLRVWVSTSRHFAYRTARAANKTLRAIGSMEVLVFLLGLAVPFVAHG